MPRETFENECRVALTPAGVAALRKAGFREVVVESSAGARANFNDEEYRAAGATVVDSAAQAFQQVGGWCVWGVCVGGGGACGWV